MHGHLNCPNMLQYLCNGPGATKSGGNSPAIKNELSVVLLWLIRQQK